MTPAAAGAIVARGLLCDGDVCDDERFEGGPKGSGRPGAAADAAACAIPRCHAT